MRKLAIIFLAILTFSCQEETVLEDDPIIGEWLLVDFTIDGIQPEVNGIDSYIMILNADKTVEMINTQPAPYASTWDIDEAYFYWYVNDGMVKYDIIELNDNIFHFKIIQNGELIWKFNKL